MRQKTLLRMILEPLAIAIALGFIVRSVVHIYSIPSASMAPTLEAGDQIVVTPYFGAKPERGHVVVFQHGDDLLVKRVVAVPGDWIDSRLGGLAATGAIESQIIPSDCYYVLGDNRDDSIDSRTWGVIPHDVIVGRARLVLWSMTSDGVARASEQGRTDAHPRRGAGRLFKWIE